MSIYTPSEDSYLLQKALKKYLKTISNKNIKIIDLGTGSGIQAKTCKELGFYNILAVDINPIALINLKNQNFKTIKSNLFSNLKKEKYDLIIFNPPYLPEDKREPLDSKLQTTAGKQGFELIVKFLKQSTNHLNKYGNILLLFSSLSKPKIIKAEINKLKYNFKLIKKEKLFFEQLYVFMISKNI